MTLNRVWIPSPNYSSRGGTAVRLIVLHTAEGALSYQSLGNFFANPSSGVSSHVGIDDTPNTVGEYVARANKAWTQGNANPYSVAVELCAFAEWTPAEWDRHPTMLANCAQWIAEEAAAFGIPLTRLTAAQAQGGAAGVCQHVDLGASGGGHWDCGPGFPMDRVIAMAAGGVPPTPPSEPEPEPILIGDTWYPMTVFSNDLDARQMAVISWFADYLGRQPDAASLSHWESTIAKAGMSAAFSAFLSQPEVAANLAGR
ncbi:MAG TPA: N-acetylmuramoyl-L-alanine amidase [Acidimicrobiales bacterium]